VLERVEWWSEVFEIPCVGYAGDAEEAAALAQAGADFVALGDFVWNDARATAALLASLAERLRSVELV
jgi:thiamine-phosphate pyrophosphorylase